MDRIEANRAIAASIEEWVGSLRDETDGDGPGILGDWMTIACMVSVNEDGIPMAKYYLGMKDGAMLPHVAKGMLYQALEELGGSDGSD